MKSARIRNLSPELERIVRKKAEAEGTSLNKAVKQQKRHLYRDLDHLAGRWNKRQASAFDRGLADQRRVDRDLWR